MAGGGYHKAHFHTGGAILLIPPLEGYTLMGRRKQDTSLKSGNGDQVVKVNWREGSVFSPPTGWFHQHFNTGKEKARQLAFRYQPVRKYLSESGKRSIKKGTHEHSRGRYCSSNMRDEDPRFG